MFADAKGFTLLEMLLVCTILSLLVGIALPRFSGTADSLEGREASRRLAATIRYAHQRSVLERKLIRVALDEDKKCFTVLTPEREESQLEEANRAESLWSVPVELPSRVRFAGVYGEDVDESARRWELKFYPDGRVPDCSIELETSGGRRYEIAVEPRTGRVTTRRLGSEDAGLFSVRG